MPDFAFTELNIETQHKRLVQFRTRLGFDRLAPLSQFDEEPMRVFFCKPTGTDSSPFDLQDWQGDAVTVAVNKTALTGSGTQAELAVTTLDWNSDETCFEGLLDLNTNELNAYIATGPLDREAAIDAILEVKVVHAAGGTRRYLHEKFKLVAAAIQMASSAPVQGQRVLTEGELYQIFQRRIGAPGDRLRLTNQEGTFAREWWVDTEGEPRDDAITLSP